MAATYKCECWGASGGHAIIGNGSGGYVSGLVSLTKETELYIYVGKQGNDYNSFSSTYMFNGGGNANRQGNYCGSCGGGATDIRIVNGNWENATSLNSRIMVAGGGGGVGGEEVYSGSCAGGLLGYDGLVITTSHLQHQGKGGTQSAGGTIPTQYSDSQNGTAGLFGKGGVGGYSHLSSGLKGGGGSGGGGGYYGGSGSCGLSNGSWCGGGGSSYISGHSGCTAKSITFNNTIMIDGYGYKWTSTKGSQIGLPNVNDSSIRQNGHLGHGYCKITWHPAL